MFDSEITAADLIAEIESEADIAPDIEKSSYIQWLNSVEQLLYSEIIKEQKRHVFDVSKVVPTQGGAILLEHPECAGYAPTRFEDIYVVYAGSTQLIKTTLTSGMIFPYCYYKDGELLGVNLSGAPTDAPTDAPTEITVIYTVRPVLKTGENISDEHVKVPAEFIDLVKAKLRGEAYKLANEDSLAAKWLNDYNVLLETFREWVRSKDSVFGL